MASKDTPVAVNGLVSSPTIVTVAIGFVILLVILGGGCSSDTGDVTNEGADRRIESETDVGDGETTVTANAENDSVIRTSLNFSDLEDDRYAVPSLERRIFESDVVVHAAVIGEYAGGLRFRAHEYLKGTGGDEFFVRVHIERRDMQWDDRPAILLLQESDVVEEYNQTAIAGGAPSEFHFSIFPWSYIGDREWSYSIEGTSPLWLPLTTTSSDLSLNSPDREFITESESPLGERHPTITLGELRDIAAWLHGGSGVDGYEQCITSSIDYIDFYRNWEGLFGEQYSEDPLTLDTESGLGADHVLLEFESAKTPEYNRVWLTGADAQIFRDVIVDDDTSASNGYEEQLKTARPLPTGFYQLTSHIQLAEYFPCQFNPELNKLPIEVTVAAPEGTLHEAFFDPVALSGGGVGAAGSSGVIDPDEFTVSSDDVEIDSLEWDSGSVVLELDDYVSLSGQTLDFIELDGSIDTSLAIADATVNQTAATWTWSVTGAPWEDGDLLMLRIRDTSTGPTVVTPRPGATPSTDPGIVIPTAIAHAVVAWNEAVATPWPHVLFCEGSGCTINGVDRNTDGKSIVINTEFGTRERGIAHVKVSVDALEHISAPTMVIERPALQYHPYAPGRTLSIVWVNDPDLHGKEVDEDFFRRYYYMPRTIMHEFGHAAGLEDLYLLECGLLGCGYGDYIMGRAEKPTAIPNEDRDYLRDVYYNHTPHPASSGQ